MNILKVYLLILACLICTNQSNAATINVACTENDLITAITTAELNAEADTLELDSGCVYSISSIDNTDSNGANGLPKIDTEIVFNGNNATIQPLNATPKFRIFNFGFSSVITFNKITIQNAESSDGVLDVTPLSLSLSGRDGHGPPGGAILAAGDLTINSSTIHNNRTGDGVVNTDTSLGRGGNGGAIYIFGNGTLNITNSTFTNNATGIGAINGGPRANSGFGGAIEIRNSAATVIRSTFNDNAATIAAGASNSLGGAISAFPDTFTAINSTFSNNAPGALRTNSLNINFTVIHNTFAFNTDYAALAFDSTPNTNSITIDNNLFNNNESNNDCGASQAMTGNNNLFGGTQACGITIGANGNITADALLKPLANNGGSTMTHDLDVGSAAINAITGADPSEQMIDQRSQPRKQDGVEGSTSDLISDMGALEKAFPVDCYVAKATNNKAFTFCL